jgi:hypothetical protein
VPHEEALAVVVRVDEPAGNVVSRAAPDLPRRRIVDVEAADLDEDVAVGVAVVRASLCLIESTGVGPVALVRFAIRCMFLLYPKVKR